MRHAHPIVAAVYDPLLASAERAFLGALRARLLESASGAVLEIGAGTGRNFAYYRSSAVSELIVVEPDPYMRRRAEARAREVRASVRWAEGTAERLPIGRASVDTIVSTLVLCSVDDPEAVVGEWGRVLRSGGTVLLIEHVRSDRPLRAWLQDRFTPVWRRIAAGCHVNRPTIETIRRCGFEFRETERLAAGPPWVQPIVAGIATAR